ncbi:class D sortase [Alkalicoccobacillus gibsonii]|uniref:Class D sortase n=1 Tax=Alkalicoccobacillus gibsonii TaxID=79881 RepID=A0ABU9VLZ9_9BACI
MRKGKSLIGLALIVVGMVFVSIPLYHEWQQTKGVSALEGALASLEVDPLHGSSQELTTEWTQEELEEVKTLEIPSIELEQYVLGETTEENLALALTQINPNQAPEDGNFSIAGHRGYRGDRHFRQLSNVSDGDEVRLTADGKTYVYEVNSISIVDPTQTDVLDDSDDPEITLITCTLSGEQRLIVKGVLVEIIEEAQAV